MSLSGRRTSPHTWRWKRHARWTRELPAKAVLNVSLDRFVWSYFGDQQAKLTRSYRLDRWHAELPGVDRDERTREALAEAAALVAYGRSRGGRRALARAIGREPARAQPPLRAPILGLYAG